MKIKNLLFITTLIALSIFSYTAYAMDDSISPAIINTTPSVYSTSYPANLSYQTNGSSFQYQKPLIIDPAVFFRALLSNQSVYNYVEYLKNTIALGQHPTLYQPSIFYETIYKILGLCEKSIANTIEFFFCNPLHRNNLVQLMRYSHQAGLTLSEIDSLRLLSLAVYGSNWFHTIEQMRFAIQTNQLSSVRDLLSFGVHPNWIVFPQGGSCIMSTLNNVQNNITLQLLEVPGVDINTADIFGKTPLIQAACNNNAKIIAKLAQLGVQNPSAHNFEKKSALDLAVERGNVAAVKTLIDLFKIDAIDKVTNAIKAQSLNYDEIYDIIHEAVPAHWKNILSPSAVLSRIEIV